MCLMSSDLGPDFWLRQELKECQCLSVRHNFVKSSFIEVDRCMREADRGYVEYTDNDDKDGETLTEDWLN